MKLKNLLRKIVKEQFSILRNSRNQKSKIDIV